MTEYKVLSGAFRASVERQCTYKGATVRVINVNDDVFEEARSLEDNWLDPLCPHFKGKKAELNPYKCKAKFKCKNEDCLKTWTSANGALIFFFKVSNTKPENSSKNV